MEGDAGSGQLTPTPPLEADERPDSDLSGHVDDAGTDGSPASAVSDAADSARDAAPVSDSRLSGRRLNWVIAAVALSALLITAAGVVALIGHRRSAAAANGEAMAVAAAKDCITATQAPDVKVMAESQRRIVECSSENFAAQANLYSGLLFDAYQTVNAQVKVTDMRAAAEKHNPDGSIDVLVATRVAMSNSQQKDQELSYRLRVRMVPSGGTYKIDNIEPVST
jgi:Mce-associated membrane protein